MEETTKNVLDLFGNPKRMAEVLPYLMFHSDIEKKEIAGLLEVSTGTITKMLNGERKIRKCEMLMLTIFFHTFYTEQELTQIDTLQKLRKKRG